MAKDIPRFPGKCPRCSADAFVGIVPADVKCSNTKCELRDPDLTPITGFAYPKEWGDEG